MPLRYASTFISHSHKDKELVLALARELTRRGILPWVDVNELPAGVNLDTELLKAVAGQLTMTAVVSVDALQSEWCRRELEPRVRATHEGSDAVIPIFLGPPLGLVNASNTLKTRWLTDDGKRVRKLGIPVEDASNVAHAEIARRIAHAHYLRLDTRNSEELVVVFDQRGGTRRVGEPEPGILPDNWLTKSCPALVFRPDQKERTESEVIHGAEWDAFQRTIIESLAESVGTRQCRRICITGNAQLAFAWLAGHFFNRSREANVLTFNSRGKQYLSIDMSDQRFRTPLDGLAANTVKWHGSPPPQGGGEVSVYIGHERWEAAVHEHRAARNDTTALAVHHPPPIRTEDDVIEIARWMTTACDRRPTRVYTALPFHAIVLLAALLKHAIGEVTFMEWDLAGRAYRPCRMPPVR